MKMLRVLKRCIVRDSGQTVAEYALVVFLVAVAAVATLSLFGVNVTSLFNSMANAL